MAEIVAPRHDLQVAERCLHSAGPVAGALWLSRSALPRPEPTKELGPRKSSPWSSQGSLCLCERMSCQASPLCPPCLTQAACPCSSMDTTDSWLPGDGWPGGGQQPDSDSGPHRSVPGRPGGPGHLPSSTTYLGRWPAGRFCVTASDAGSAPAVKLCHVQILEVREQRRKGAPSIIPKEPTIWEGLKQGCVMS